MGFRKILLFLLVFFQLVHIKAQLDTKNIIPLSPNAAAIARYGEVPVSLYTGIPNISVPIYTISSRKLNLPLQLSYHAGGNKVESIASWVGYGWSLGTIPSISRSVNGIADEDPGGFINLFSGKTAKQLFEEERVQNTPIWQNFLQLLTLNEVDSEADIFYYNIPGKSGKFFYSQQEQKFLTYPRTEIKVSFINNGISIIDEDGTKYFFGEKESQSNSSYLQSTPVTTTWNISYINDVNETENISFEYEQENHLYSSNKGSARYYHYSGINTSRLVGYTFPISQISSTTQRLKKITFSGGYVQFYPELTPRQDFNGGYALKEIGVYNFANTLVKKYAFRYKYLQGSVSGPPQNHQDSKWLFLEAVDVVSNTQSTDKLTYNFQYDESVPPSRNSFAQDYWGYYNGASSNPSLIPATALLNPANGSPIMIGDANREINSNYNQFGILKKIVYPTGGTSEFEYESNKVKPDQNMIVYKTEASTLEASGQTNNYHLVGDVFTINNLPNERLNGNHPDGGAFIKIEAGYFGCDLSAGSSPCANVSLNGQTAQNSNLYWPIWGNSPGNMADFGPIYIPNGTYKLEASFSQDPPNWGNFSAMASWEVIDETVTEKIVPGLRIKAIKSKPSEAGNYLEKKFKYLSDYNDPTSHSGKMIYSSYLVYHRNLFAYCEPPEMVNGVQGGYYIKLSSYSNYPAVAHNGSNVGYSSVFTEDTEDGLNGYTQNQFENIADDVNNVFPYVPLPSNEHLRGLMREEKVYKKNSGNFFKVTETNNEYLGISAGETQKGFNVRAAMSYDPPNLIYSGMTPTHDIFEPYETYSTKTENNNTITINYDQDSEQKYVLQEITKTFDSKLLNVISQETKNGKGETVKANFKYPGDYSSTPIMVDMVQKNMLKNVIENTDINVTKSNMELSKTITNYQYWQNNTIIQPSSVEKSLLGNALETDVVINSYDSKGNILQFTGKDGVTTSFVWGYNQLYPVAKIINSTSGIVQSYITQSILDNAVGGSDDIAIRSHLNNLRNISGALVATFTYNPLVGITSETDPNGRTKFYEYDAFNRLVLIRDQDGKVLRKICYNYAGQPEDCSVATPPPVYYNVQMSQAFTRNNCPACQTGSQVTYTVAQGTYSSTVSQVAADQLAQNDIAANGQNYANTNGSCTQGSGVTITYQNETSATGFVALYTHNSTGQTYSFNVPASGSGTLGCVPAGTYSLSISKPGNMMLALFGSGCFTQSGTSAFFGKVNVSSCNTVIIGYDL